MSKQHQYLNLKLLVKKTTFPFSLLIMKRTITNSERSENTVNLDAAYWLPKVNRELFKWLDDEGKSKVRLVTNLPDFWKLEEVHQDHIMAAWWSIYRKGRSGRFLRNRPLLWEIRLEIPG